MSKMFPFITVPDFNPLGGECKHNCSYSWCKQLINRYPVLKKKYQGTPFIDEKQLKRVFKSTDFVFVCDMCDLFGDWVPSELILRILDYIENSPAQFLLLTKNPKRYHEFPLPKNCVAGATIESDWNLDVTKAPDPMKRIEAMRELHHRKMVSVEPIMVHSDAFPFMVASIHPEFVAVGYDNYNNHLQEPSLSETESLISVLESFGIKVYRKTIREKN